MWLLSVKQNPTIDFYLVTDIADKMEYPENVHIISMTFIELKERIKELFGADSRLEKPYKICDYRPAFGLIFKLWLTNYDFWGYCDVDMIFGDIRKFVTEDLLAMNKKLYSHGHFVLVKNDEEMNHLFKMAHNFVAFTFDEIKVVDLATHFDEWRGFSVICSQMNIPWYDGEQDYADVDFYQYQFRLVNHNKKRRPQIFQCHQGRLFLYYIEGESVLKREYMYIHLQKRSMVNQVRQPEKGFLIIPKYFIENRRTIDASTVIRLGAKKPFYLRKYKNFIQEVSHNLRYGGVGFRLKLINKRLKKSK